MKIKGIIFLSLVFFVGLVSSYSSYNVQYSQPGYNSFSFLDGQGLDIYGSSINGYNCNEQESDFVLQIAPLGCTPVVVRSDLLEEQNVPVFCPLMATKINPLINVEAIEYMDIGFAQGSQKSIQVSGVGFHPARAALKTSSSTLINSPILNNVGYAVIVLKREPVEANMPDYVEGTLTARIRYDIENAYGVGEVSYTLPVLSDDEFENNFNEYSFWNGRGYLRATSIDRDSVNVVLYRDEFQRIGSFRLTEQNPVSETSIPGFYCNARMDVKLNEIKNPDMIAKIRYDEKVIDVEKGEKFGENRCQVISLIEEGVNEEVKITCKTDSGSESFVLNLNSSVVLNYGGESGDYNVGELVKNVNGNNYYLIYVGGYREIGNKRIYSEKIEDLRVILYKSSTLLGEKELKSYSNSAKSKILNKGFEGDDKFIVMSLSNGKEGFTFGGYYSGLKNEDYIENSDNYLKAIEDYERILNSYSSEKEEGVGYGYGEDSLHEAIDLSFKLKDVDKTREFCSEFYERYPNSVLIKDVTSLCSNELGLSNKGVASRIISINGKSVIVSLEDISIPSYDDYSASVVLEGVNYDLSYDSQIFFEDGVGYLELVDILDEDSAKVKVVLNSKNDKGVSKLIENTLTLEKGKNGVVTNTDKTIYLSNVNLNKVASISLIPKIENARSEANFSYKIGIEKRAISLAPEEIEKRIDNLNQSIEKWSELSDNLGKVVKGFKAACLTTGALLTVKNFIGNTDGGAIARQEVMRGDGGWIDICNEEIKSSGKDLDECLLSHNDEIESDVDKLSSIISSQESINEENKKERIEEIAGNLGEEISNPMKPNEKVDVESLREGLNYENIKLGDARDIERWNEVLNSDASDELKKIAQNNLYSKLKSLEGNIQREIKISELRSSLSEDGFSNFNVDVWGSKSAKEGVYDGGVTSRNVGGISSGTRYDVVSVNAEDYIVTLEDNGNGKSYRTSGVYNIEGAAVSEDISKDVISKFPTFVKYDETSYNNKFVNPEVKYFESDPYKGLPSLVPFDIDEGWYAYMKQTLPGAVAGVAGIQGIRTYDDSGMPASFMICNVGANGKAEAEFGYGDDICRNFNPGTGSIYGTFAGMNEGETERLVREAISGIEDAGRAYKSGVKEISVNGQKIKVGNPSVNIPDIECSDYMSPSDCNLLFNVCDPVICPSSRCDLGGNYPVDNVIQSGIIGSIALCMPNFPEVKVPICLTGVQAGIDGLVSVMENYQSCLEENLETGRTVGICDEIHSVYMCEFMWRQSVPVARLALPKILEVITGQGSRGGGEYLGISSAWANAEKSITYMTQYYGAESYKSFKARTTDEAGTTICKAFASARYPSSGEWFDALVEPDSPEQYHGWFSEIEYSSATVPATSQYKVFYHIYAGKDRGAYFQVYMKAPEGSSYYYSNPRYVVDSDYIKAGGYASQTKDFIAPTGYKEMCISVNGKDECGFQKVSTSFALNYIEDQYLKEQATQEVSSESECVSGSGSFYSLLQPNIQEGVDEALNPQLYNHGIVRVCSTLSPGKGTDNKDGTENARWIAVGNCGSDKMICWLDRESVENAVKGIDSEEEILQSRIDKAVNILDEEYYNEGEFSAEVERLRGLDSEEIISEIDDDLLRKAFFGKNIAYLLMLRGDSYGFLAIEDYVSNVQEESDVDEDNIPGVIIPEEDEDNIPSAEIPEKDDDTPSEVIISGVSCKDISKNPESQLNVKFSDCISVEKINEILANTQAKNTGEIFYNEGKKYDIDPVIALAFFNQESSLGQSGVARFTKSIGNIKYTSNCPGTNYNGYCAYASWEDGITHWYKLISGNVYVGQNLDTVELIIPKYSPESDGNNPKQAISNIRSFVIKKIN